MPEGTKAFAVVVHDPDAPLVDGFTHWVAYGIPGSATGLPEGGGDAVQGVNSHGRARLHGPRAAARSRQPPLLLLGLRARRRRSSLEPGLDRRALHRRIEDHVIEQARLVGTYKR